MGPIKRARPPPPCAQRRACRHALPAASAPVSRAAMEMQDAPQPFAAEPAAEPPAAEPPSDAGGGEDAFDVKMEDEEAQEAPPAPPPLRDKPTQEELAALVKQRQLFHAQSEEMLQLAKRHKEVTGARTACAPGQVGTVCVWLAFASMTPRAPRRGPPELRAEGRQRTPAGGALRSVDSRPAAAAHPKATPLKPFAAFSCAGGRQAHPPRALAARRGGADGAVRHPVRAPASQLRIFVLCADNASSRVVLFLCAAMCFLATSSSPPPS